MSEDFFINCPSFKQDIIRSLFRNQRANRRGLNKNILVLVRHLYSIMMKYDTRKKQTGIDM